ncbi:MAG: hypothetical protein LBT24_06465 [Tannerella sp.]|jgi:hypothetical protein|nr:hypothetical protein [Tannerella sp.]
MKIYHNNTEILDVNVNDGSYRYREIKGEHSITLYFSLPEHIEIPVGAYCEFEAQTYTIEKPEALKMIHSRNFEYTVIFEASQAKLKKYKFKNPVDRRLKFNLTAQPQEHLQMLIDNLNAREDGWEIGECVSGTEKLISYNHTYCLDALDQMSETFETEWEINDKTISLRKVEYNKDNPLALSYGKGNGFKPEIGRSNYEDQIPVEILYTQGGDRNIDPSKYDGKKELLLPKNQTIQYDGSKFEGEDDFVSSQAKTYIVDEDGFSIRRADKETASMAEDSLDCSEIYPSRVGIISSVVVVNTTSHFYDIVDDSIPAALNFEDCLIAGEKMTVVFQTGMLAGKEFEAKYYHNSVNGKAPHRFELVPQEIDGVTMPDNVFAPVTGDKYAVFNVMLPAAYISDDATKTGASWDMFKTGVKYLYDNEDQKFTFTGELDGIWAKNDWLNIGGKIKIGGYVSFTDERFQPEAVLVRIKGIKDYINNPHSPEIELSNSTVSGTVSSQLKKIDSQDVLINSLYQNSLQFTKRRFRDSQETLYMLQEAFINNFSESINPVTVQTMAMLIGDESLQFRFVNSMTEPIEEVANNVTYDTETKILHVPSGIIQHMTLGIDSISSSHSIEDYRFWSLPEFDTPPLTDPEKKYYFYAKVKEDTSDPTGVFYISETPIGMAQIAGWYHLLMGVLNSEYDGARSYVSLYGFTEILPGRITTDKVISSDGQNFLDFVNNAFRVGNSQSSIDWNVSTANALSIVNAAIKLGVTLEQSGIQLNPDGSGMLGNGNIEWDSLTTKIADWIIKNGKITSQNTTNDGTSRAQLDGENGSIEFNSDISTHNTTGGMQNVKQTIIIDSTQGLLEARNSLYDSVKISSNGIFSNSAETDVMPTGSQVIRGAIVGLGNGAMPKDVWGLNYAIAGVVGKAQNSSSNPTPAYGGLFVDLLALGLIFKIKYISGSTASTTNLSTSETFVLSIATAGIQTVVFPTNPMEGHILFFKQMNTGTMKVMPASEQVMYDDSTSNDYLNLGMGDMMIAICASLNISGTNKNVWVVKRW